MHVCLNNNNHLDYNVVIVVYFDSQKIWLKVLIMKLSIAHVLFEFMINKNL